jgi:hypothetical protein
MLYFLSGGSRVATAATKKGKKSKDKAGKSFAVQYLEDVIFESMLNTGQGAKSREIANELEVIVGLHPKFIRRTLFYSDRFDMEDRRWNLALRTAIQLPFEGSLDYALTSYGKPMTLRALHNEMALVHRRPVDFFDELLAATLRKRPDKYAELPDERWVLRRWLLDTSDAEPDGCFMRNFFLEQEETRPLVEELLDTRMSTDQPVVEMAAKLLRKVERPIPHKVMSYVLWRLREGEVDAARLLEECEQEPRLLLMSGPMWGLQEFVEGYCRELKRLSRRAEKEEDTEWAEEEEPEGPIIITPSDLEEVYKFLRRRKRPQPAGALVEAVFDYGPASRRFQESVDALMSAMSLDARFLRAGRQTWALPAMMPKHTSKVPNSLLPAEVPENQQEVDAELTDEGLEPVLVAWVHDPRYEDFGEEPEIDIGPEQQPTDELRYVLLHDHWKAGTLKVRVCDRRFYPAESDLVCASFVDEETGKSYPVWLSYTTSLLYEIGDWYKARKLGPGSVFRVSQGSTPDEFLVSYSEEIDQYVGLSQERVKEVTKLRPKASKESWSVLDIMQRLVADRDKGVSFMALWAEVNVIRRTTRRLVASNLASYHCFYQRPANSDMWVFDERKVTQGRKKTKRKYLRR